MGNTLASAAAPRDTAALGPSRPERHRIRAPAGSVVEAMKVSRSSTFVLPFVLIAAACVSRTVAPASPTAVETKPVEPEPTRAAQAPAATPAQAPAIEVVKPSPASADVAADTSSSAASVGMGAVRTPELLQRVGGDREIAIEVVEGVYRCDRARIESPLPVGYPEPTPPGAIDIKEYPSVRRAEWIESDAAGGVMGGGFFPLFNHIKKREIAMTSPVEMDFAGLYSDFMNDEPAEEGETKMSFLYRTQALGPVGEDGKIVVRDTAPVTVLSIGVKGGLDVALELDKLRTWLKAQDAWQVAGDPRMFVYNGPFTDPSWRWSEVQLPIRKRGETNDGTASPVR
jgi:hypothetical protein